MNPNSYYSYRIAANYHWIIEGEEHYQISLDGKKKKTIRYTYVAKL